MSKKEKITSRKGLFGDIVHYDSKGNKIGTSKKGFFGGTNHYDNNGHKIGSSHKGLFGSTNHYDSKWNKVGTSTEGFFGTTNHYDTKGHKAGYSREGFLGGNKSFLDDTESNNIMFAATDINRALMSKPSLEQSYTESSTKDYTDSAFNSFSFDTEDSYTDNNEDCIDNYTLYSDEDNIEEEPDEDYILTVGDYTEIQDLIDQKIYEEGEDEESVKELLSEYDIDAEDYFI